MDIFAKNFKALKEILIFKPPTTRPPFVLKEAEHSPAKAAESRLSVAVEQHAALLRYAQRVTTTLEKTREVLKEPIRAETMNALKAELAALDQQKRQLSPIVETYSLTQDPIDQALGTSIEENKLALERIYNLPNNKDLVIRSFMIPASPPVIAYLAYIEGLVDKKIISLSILQPLMLMGDQDRQLYQKDLLNELITKYLPGNRVRLASTMRDVADSLNMGDAVIFLDGIAEAVVVETKGQEHRSIDRPTTEQTVRGSQSAFTETLKVNTALVRSILRTSDLTTEMLRIGLRGRTPCAIMYLNSVINPDLVKEAKRRLGNIAIDFITEAGTLEQFIVDSPAIPYPQTLSTERPDRVAAALTEGRFAILLDGAPFAIVAPISLFTLLHSGEDFSYSWMSASLGRLLRLFGAAFALILPGVYIAISYFHQEALPTDLILAIAGARERVPFPSVLEIVAMEFAFELLREAGVRIPGMLGSTIGIVGAIILGQAGVAAGIVSPITVMIIAVTGLASFAISDFSLAMAVRITRFVLEVLAANFGLVGVAAGLLAMTGLLCSIKSFGMPYLTPIAPKTKGGFDIILRGPVESQELRPDELNPQDERRQATISRKWKEKEPAGEEDEV